MACGLSPSCTLYAFLGGRMLGCLGLEVTDTLQALTLRWWRGSKRTPDALMQQYGLSRNKSF